MSSGLCPVVNGNPQDTKVGLTTAKGLPRDASGPKCSALSSWSGESVLLVLNPTCSVPSTQVDVLLPTHCDPSMPQGPLHLCLSQWWPCWSRQEGETTQLTRCISRNHRNVCLTVLEDGSPRSGRQHGQGRAFPWAEDLSLRPHMAAGAGVLRSTHCDKE